MEKFNIKIYKKELVSDSDIDAENELIAKTEALKRIDAKEEKDVEYIIEIERYRKPSEVLSDENRKIERENWEPTEFKFGNGVQKE